MAYSFDPKDDIEAQWQKWLLANPIENFPVIDEQELKAQTIKDLSYVSKMDVKEYTLYQKWCEVQDRYPFETVTDLWAGETKVIADEEQRRAIAEIKANLWNPENIDDYLKLEPELIYVNKQKLLPELWNCIRTFSSTMKNNSNIGRNLNFIVKDKVTKKYLGSCYLGVDFYEASCRCIGSSLGERLRRLRSWKKGYPIRAQYERYARFSSGTDRIN